MMEFVERHVVEVWLGLIDPSSISLLYSQDRQLAHNP